MHSSQYKLMFLYTSFQKGTPIKIVFRIIFRITTAQYQLPTGQSQYRPGLLKERKIIFIFLMWLFLHPENYNLFNLVTMEKKYRAEIRFRFYHYIFYIGGVPLFDTAVSNLYRVYSFLCHVCFYMTIIAMFMDNYNHLEDWDYILHTSMFFSLFICECCTIMYFR